MLNITEILKIAVVSILSQQAFAESISLGPAEYFDKPFNVAVTIVEKRDSLLYWAVPLEQDEEGIRNVKAFIDKSRSNNYMPVPLAFQFRVAGLRDGNEEGLDFTKDDFSEKSRATIDGAFEGKTVLLSCYGNFRSHIVPFCNVFDINNHNVASHLIGEGLLLPDSTKGRVPETTRKEFEDYVEKARTEKKGIWRPFHSMFRGIQ